ncbi:MAG: rRNA maturation RNase YbeY [Desulfobacterales bacterium]|nr:rRNA maturation RNase YbeY [Desulfobacterales bacterium]
MDDRADRRAEPRVSRTGEGPTNVIAFPMQEGRFADLSPNLLGDVVISRGHGPPRRPGAAGLDAWSERLTQLLVHGLLHLCGYDHEHGAAQARRMAAKSRRLMKKIERAESVEAWILEAEYCTARFGNSELARADRLRSRNAATAGDSDITASSMASSDRRNQFPRRSACT